MRKFKWFCLFGIVLMGTSKCKEPADYDQANVTISVLEKIGSQTFVVDPAEVFDSVKSLDDNRVLEGGVLVQGILEHYPAPETPSSTVVFYRSDSTRDTIVFSHSWTLVPGKMEIEYEFTELSMTYTTLADSGYTFILPSKINEEPDPPYYSRGVILMMFK